MEKQKPKWKTWHKVVVGLCLLGTIGVFVGDKKADDGTVRAQSSLTPQQKDSADRRDLIAEAFSSWDGSHRNLVKAVKENMNDPKSFEHVETKFWDFGDSNIVVLMKYRGKNGFGGVVTETIKAQTIINGTIVKVFE
ncbi:MAG TPA: hypothetical protein VK173_02675 [Lacibacter sp.]|nr:hypothetical protein [Lacibacter sp.]